MEPVAWPLSQFVERNLHRMEGAVCVPTGSSPQPPLLAASGREEWGGGSEHRVLLGQGVSGLTLLMA